MCDVQLNKLKLIEQLHYEIYKSFKLIPEIEIDRIDNTFIISIDVKKKDKRKRIVKEIEKLYHNGEFKKLLNEIHKSIKEFLKENKKNETIERKFIIDEPFSIYIKELDNTTYILEVKQNKNKRLLRRKLITTKDILLKEILEPILKRVNKDIIIEDSKIIDNHKLSISIVYKNERYLLIVKNTHNINSNFKEFINSLNIERIIHNIKRFKKIVDEYNNIRELIRRQIENKTIDELKKKCKKIQKSYKFKNIEYCKIRDQIIGILKKEKNNRIVYIIRPITCSSIELYMFKEEKRNRKLQLVKYIDRIDNHFELLYYLSNENLNFEDITEKTIEYYNSLFDLIKEEEIKRISDYFDLLFEIIDILEKDRNI